MNSVLEAAQALQWREVPATAIALAEKSAAMAKEVRAAINELPTDGFLSLHFHPERNDLLAAFTKDADSDVIGQWATALQDCGGIASSRGTSWENSIASQPGMAKIAMRSIGARYQFEKEAESPTASTLAKLLAIKPGIIPGSPNAMIGTLSGGLLGAGLGYGAGWVGEKMLPEKWKKGRLSKTLAMIGGGIGATPGLMGMYDNYHAGRPVYQDAPIPTPANDLSTRPAFYADPPPEPWDAKHYKQSNNTTHGGAWPTIDVPGFTRSLWADPYLKPREQAAAAGLVQGASAMLGGARMIGPADIARMTVGMGTGYMSGAIVGKVFGALTGAPPAAQKRLRNAGIWAGIVSNIIPIAFG